MEVALEKAVDDGDGGAKVARGVAAEEAEGGEQREREIERMQE